MFYRWIRNGGLLPFSLCVAIAFLSGCGGDGAADPEAAAMLAALQANEAPIDATASQELALFGRNCMPPMNFSEQFPRSDLREPTIRRPIQQPVTGTTQQQAIDRMRYETSKAKTMSDPAYPDVTYRTFVKPPIKRLQNRCKAERDLAWDRLRLRVDFDPGHVQFQQACQQMGCDYRFTTYDFDPECVRTLQGATNPAVYLYPQLTPLLPTHVAYDPIVRARSNLVSYRAYCKERLIGPPFER